MSDTGEITSKDFLAPAGSQSSGGWTVREASLPIVGGGWEVEATTMELATRTAKAKEGERWLASSWTSLLQ